MTTFAIISNGFVENIAAAESQFILQALLPDKTIMQETELTKMAWIGAEVIDGKFKPPQPYASWSFDETSFKWQSPIPKPNDEFMYYWDEDTLSWIEVTLPTEPVE